MQYLNQAAVKRLALRYSKENRAGKFTRVGESFYNRINAQIVHIVAKALETDEVPLYIKRSEVKKLAQQMVAQNNLGKNKKLDGASLKRINDRVAEVIVSEVQRHPSTGKTLQ